MNILKKIRAKQADLFAPPVAIAFLGDSVTQGCFEVYLTMRAAAMRRRRNTHRRWTEFLQN